MVAPGDVLSERYEVTALIASGGMGAVYRAVDRLLGRAVALKVFRAPDTDRARFELETSLLARLHHPHLVQLFDGGDADGVPFIVLELAEGPTLDTLMGSGPMAPERVAEVGAELASALAYLHHEGVVHRDVKPSNVLTDARGRVLLGDLGIARAIDTAGMTATGFTMGTAAYVAPEQLAAEPVGPAADVYALGVVLLECLTGTRAFSGTQQEVVLARLQHDPSLEQVRDPAWLALLTAMTRRAPDGRPDARSVERSLRAPTTSSADATAMVGPATEVLAVPPQPVTGARTTRRRRRWALLAVLAAALVAVLALAARRDGDSPAVPADSDNPTQTTVRPTTTISPTSTTASCEQLEAEADAIDEQLKDLDDLFKGDASGKAAAHKQLDEEKRQLERSLRDC